MENKSKSIKIVLYVILTVILISVIGIVIFSMNRNKDEIEKNEITNSKNENEVVENQVQNQIQDNPQNQGQSQTQNSVKNENVVIPSGSEQDQPPKAISTPSNDKDEVAGSRPTE